MGGRPVEHRGEPRTAVELARVATRDVPLARGVVQMQVQLAPLCVLLEPAAQARPFAQQRLVRDLDLALADRDEAIVGEHGEDFGHAFAFELVERDAATHYGVALAFAGQPQEDPASELAVVGFEPLVGALGQPRHRTVHAARAFIRADLQVPAFAVLPQLEQRRRQQGQGARLALDVGEQHLHEIGLEPQPGPARGELDRAAQLVAAHRPDQHVVGTQQPGELRVCRAAPVEVRPHRDQHQCATTRIAGTRDERVGERRALALVATGGEDLFELIDGDDKPALRHDRRDGPLERSQRLVPGSHQGDRPALAAGQDAGRQPREQASPQRGGLAAPRGSDDTRQRRTGEPRDHLGDEPLAAEEELGVLHLERRQPLERADHGTVVQTRAGLRAFPLRVQLDDAAHQIVLGRAQRRALGREAGRGVRQAPDGHLARLRARHTMQVPRYPVAHLREPFDQGFDVLG